MQTPDSLPNEGSHQPPPPRPRFTEPEPFTLGNAVSLGWAAFTSRYPLILGATLLYLLIVMAAWFVSMFASFITLLPLADWAAQFLFYPLLWIGLLWVSLRVIRGEPADIGAMFHAFKRYWPVVGTNALVLVVIYAIVFGAMIISLLFGGLAAAAIAASGGSGGGTASAMLIVFLPLFLLLFILPVLYVLPRIWLAPLVCLDTYERRLGVVDSFKAAWAMTARPGVRVTTILLWLLGIALTLVSTLALILPIFFVAIPLSTAVSAAAYWQISRQHWRALSDNCRVCNYSLRGARGEVCPECGTVIPEDQRGLI